MKNIYLLRKVPIISEIKPVSLTEEILSDFDEQKKEKAFKNSKKVVACRIVYKSQGHKVVGYLIEPKKGDKLPCIIWNRGGNRAWGKLKITEDY